MHYGLIATREYSSSKFSHENPHPQFEYVSTLKQSLESRYTQEFMVILSGLPFFWPLQVNRDPNLDTYGSDMLQV